MEAPAATAFGTTISVRPSVKSCFDLVLGEESGSEELQNKGPRMAAFEGAGSVSFPNALLEGPEAGRQLPS